MKMLFKTQIMMIYYFNYCQNVYLHTIIVNYKKNYEIE